jgi:hypothetical protein
VSTKFKGHFLEVQPSGSVHLIFKSTGNHYTWNKVTNYVNGLLYGKIWMSNQGELQIKNHKTQETCDLKYHEPPYFRNEVTNKVTGRVKDNNNMTNYVLQGSCTDLIECFKVLKPSIVESNDEFKNLSLGPSQILWKRTVPE